MLVAGIAGAAVASLLGCLTALCYRTVATRNGKVTTVTSRTEEGADEVYEALP